MNYVIYLRKSTESKERQVMSLPAQKRVLLDIAEKENLNVVDIFEESRSALKPGRPIFNKVMDMFENGEADSLLVWDVNRISRNPRDTGNITQLMQDGFLKCIKTNNNEYWPGDNALPLALNFALSNESSLALGRVVSRGNKEKLEKGGWPHRAPLGYKTNKDTKPASLTVNKHEAKHVVKAFELYSTGLYSCKTIADMLYHDGLRSRSGKKVSHSNIHLMIQRKFYFGMMESKGKLYKGNHTPLVSKKLFDLCQDIRTGYSKPKPQKAKELHFSMRGIFSCEVCGCNITAEQQKGINYYHCTNGKKICDQKKKFIREDDLEQELVSKIETLKFDDELIDIIHDAALERFYDEQDNKNDTKKLLENELQALRDKESVLTDKLLEDIISNDVYTKKSKEYKLSIFDLERRIDNSDINIEKELATFELTKKAFRVFNFNDISFSEMENKKKYQTLQKLLSNSTLKNENGSKTLTLQYKKPYDIIAKASALDMCPEMLPY